MPKSLGYVPGSVLDSSDARMRNFKFMVPNSNDEPTNHLVFLFIHSFIHSRASSCSTYVMHNNNSRRIMIDSRRPDSPDIQKPPPLGKRPRFESVSSSSSTEDHVAYLPSPALSPVFRLESRLVTDQEPRTDSWRKRKNEFIGRSSYIKQHNPRPTFEISDQDDRRGSELLLSLSCPRSKILNLSPSCPNRTPHCRTPHRNSPLVQELSQGQQTLEHQHNRIIGRWSEAEEARVEDILARFQSGQLRLSSRMSLRNYVAQELNCSPLRVSKKFIMDIRKAEQTRLVSTGVGYPKAKPKNANTKTLEELPALEKPTDVPIMWFQGQPLRRGRWTAWEESYAHAIVKKFKSGCFHSSLPGSMSLRKFLSRLLHCDPMRVSKKFCGSSKKNMYYCVAKNQSHSSMTDTESCSSCDTNHPPEESSSPLNHWQDLEELVRLEQFFLHSIQSPESASVTPVAPAIAPPRSMYRIADILN